MGYTVILDRITQKSKKVTTLKKLVFLLLLKPHNDLCPPPLFLIFYTISNILNIQQNFWLKYFSFIFWPS